VRLPHVAILLLSAHLEVEHAMDLLPSGDGVGYLLAEGRSNTGIARQLWGTVKKQVHSILTKLALPQTDDDHRQVLAVVTFREARWRLRSITQHSRRSGPG
jgi:DNA-binding NarL/FixJ family response regulator